MRESGYYPPGAEFDPNAPYNQHDPDPVPVIANVTVTLTNDVRVFTEDYCCDEDEHGELKNVHLNCSYKDVEKLIADQHKSIPELLRELAKYINGELADGCTSRSRKQELESMLDDCKGWEYHIEVEDFSKE